MCKSTHTLTLKAKRVIRSTRTMLYTATCSCEGWKVIKSASEARELHAAHLQELLGPEAQERKLDGAK